MDEFGIKNEGFYSEKEKIKALVSQDLPKLLDLLNTKLYIITNFDNLLDELDERDVSGNNLVSQSNTLVGIDSPPKDKIINISSIINNVNKRYGSAMDILGLKLRYT